MLRRKLLVMLGSLLLLVVVAAISAIGLLHSVLGDLVAASTAAVSSAAETAQLETALGRLEAGLHELRHNAGAAPPPHLFEDAAAVGEGAGRLERLLHPAGAGPAIREVRAALAVLSGHLAAAAAPGEAARHLEPILDSAVTLRAAVTELTKDAGARAVGEQDRLIRKFRMAGLAVGVVFLLLLNVSIIVLLRAASMVLNPVDALVDASRRLAREEFDHRVTVDRRDEFGELAAAYNSLAEQLASNEQRKVETLHQVARTLSHELNNAISAIDLQLELVGRRSGGDQALVEPLRRCQQILAGMARTIESFTRVRRIVLTDYLSGVKMLDLERSVGEAPPPSPGPEARPVPATKAR